MSTAPKRRWPRSLDNDRIAFNDGRTSGRRIATSLLAGTERAGAPRWSVPVTEVFDALLSFLDRVDRAGLPYTLHRIRRESILVDITRPGWRWEVEFMRDGESCGAAFVIDGKACSTARRRRTEYDLLNAGIT
jgi:hypothetical protein